MQKAETEDLARIKHTPIYVEGEINDQLVRMMIDSGAQVCVISEILAVLLKINHKIDRSKRAIASGVGTSTIVGWIANCPVKIFDNFEIPLNFYVMENNRDPMMILIGLDFLVSYNCMIDFRTRSLWIDSQQVPFLNELQCQDLKQPLHAPTEKIKRMLNRTVADIVQDERTKLVNLMRKIVGNIMDDPENPKYRDLNLESKTIKDMFDRYPGTNEMFTHIGFQVNNNRLVYYDDHKKLQVVEQVLASS